MADIRKTPLLDDFQRPAENPLSFGGKWAGIGGTGLRISSPGHCHSNPGGGSGVLNVQQSYWTPATYSVSGTKEVEVWCNCGGFANFQDGWLLGLFNSSYQGYSARWSEEIGNNAVQIRRFNGTGSNVVLKDDRTFGNLVPNAGTDILLFRTNGANVELWWSSDNGATWTLRAFATDSTYRSNLRLVIGLNNAPEWLGFGGGLPITSQQIYRRARWRPRHHVFQP